MKKSLLGRFHQPTLYFLRVILLILILPQNLFSQNWNNCGKNALRNGLSPIPGPASPEILWQGTEPALFGMPIFIEEDKLVTMRFLDITYAPVVCHDLFTGQLLWSVDVTNLTGRTVPVGMRDGKVYVMRWLESPSGDSLIALDAETGERLWVSDELIRPAYMVGCVFADNGDLIVEGNLELLRIDATDGSLVWKTTAIPWVVGWLCPTIFENIVYVQQNAFESITAIDINSGSVKYSAEVLPLGGNAQTGIMVGSDGTIYAQTTGIGGQITAFKDDGNSLSPLWSSPAPGYSVFCYMAEGPDSTIYVPANGKIIRLEKTTGTIIDSSDLIGSPSLLIAMVSVGSDGKMYIAAENSFHCTNPDLTPIFSETIQNLNTSACTLGPKNIMAIAGAGTELIVYQSVATSASEIVIENDNDIKLAPNPSTDYIMITTSKTIESIECRNSFGQLIAVSKENNRMNISSLAKGLYTITVTTTDGKIEIRKFIKK